MPRQLAPQVVKVGVATTDWSYSLYDERGWPVHGGANWIRFGQNQRLTKNHMVIGHLVRSGNRLGVQTFDQQIHFDCAVLFIQRYMDDWLPDAISVARQNGQIVVNDVDDWFWGLHPDNQASRVVKPEVDPRNNIDHYRASLQASTIVTTSTPFLANAISEWGVNTTVIPNGVTSWHFRPRNHRPGKPIVGWCGSTAHRSADLEVVAAALQSMVNKVTFHHTGEHDHHPSFASKTGLPTRAVSTLPMLPPSEYPFGFVFDIGIVPLNDIQFNVAKSWIKGIEYAAAGIPFVASHLGEYRRLYNKYGIGRTASTTEEWVEHLTELGDHQVRASEAARARKIVEDELDTRYMAKQWDRLVWDLA